MPYDRIQPSLDLPIKITDAVTGAHRYIWLKIESIKIDACMALFFGDHIGNPGFTLFSGLHPGEDTVAIAVFVRSFPVNMSF